MITEVNVSVADNSVVERYDTLLPIYAYRCYFFQRVRADSSAVFHNGDINPRGYKKVQAVTYANSSVPLTDTARLRPLNQDNRWRRRLTGIVATWPGVSCCGSMSLTLLCTGAGK